jgi:uncharacterized lipoprotein YbaY
MQRMTHRPLPGLRFPHVVTLSVAVACLTLANAAFGQAVIRSRDVLANEWASAPLTSATAGAPSLLPSAAASPLASASGAWNQQAKGWRLGVAIENLETGVRLTDVERGLPADNAGLKRDDVILAVGGYQVGYVDGALFDLGDELRRRADARGRVTFLAFDARNRQLRSMPVTLTPQNAAVGVRGQILCKERISFSSRAVLTVRLRDVTFPNWQNVTVGQQQIPNPSNPPIPFAIDFDPSTLFPDHRYAVDAWLADGSQIIVQTSAPISVNPLTSTTPLQVTLVKPTASTPPGNYYAAQIDQVNQWYRQYLMRDATTQELAAWQAHLQAGRSVQDVQAYLLSSSEYYDRVGNQPARYLNELYRNLYGRAPTSTELAQFQAQYAQMGGSGRNQYVQDVLRLQPAP